MPIFRRHKLIFDNILHNGWFLNISSRPLILEMFRNPCLILADNSLFLFLYWTLYRTFLKLVLVPFLCAYRIVILWIGGTISGSFEEYWCLDWMKKCDFSTLPLCFYWCLTFSNYSLSLLVYDFLEADVLSWRCFYLEKSVVVEWDFLSDISLLPCMFFPPFSLPPCSSLPTFLMSTSLSCWKIFSKVRASVVFTMGWEDTLFLNIIMHIFLACSYFLGSMFSIFFLTIHLVCCFFVSLQPLLIILIPNFHNSCR